jgi:hypothetical protein
MMRPFACLAAVAAILILASSASAQYYLPFIDPGYFEPDFQFFAPAEVGEFGGPAPANTGVYFDYDRTYVNMSRPEGEPSLFSDTDGDFTWGNRYEIGYMTDEGTGWQIVHWHLDGPNVHLQNAQQQFFADELDPAIVTWYWQGRDSVNVAKLSSFELNKVWRRKQFHNGSVLEILLGYRHMNFKDYYRREELGELPGPVAGTTFVTYQNELAEFMNVMHGGQLGGRYFGQRGHWLLSMDVRFFAVQNFQQLKLTNESWIFDSDPLDGQLIDVIGNDVIRNRTHSHTAEFVWGGEVRAEASYEVTREINLRFGMVFLDLGQGIGRGNILANNRQDVQIAGLTFGFTVNR